MTHQLRVVANAGYNPGKLVGIDELGVVRPQPDDGTWIGRGVRITSTRESEDGQITEFVCFELTTKEAIKAAACVHRLLSCGSELEIWPHDTLLEPHAGRYWQSTDSLETLLFGRQAKIRQIRRSLNPSEQIVGLIVQGEKLSESDERIVRLLVDFFAGSRSQPILSDSFDGDGLLIERTWYGSSQAQFTNKTSEPIDPMSFSSLGSKHFSEMVDALHDQITRKMPMEAALRHLNDASTANVTTDIFFLTLAVHTIVEGYAKVSRTDKFMSENTFSKRIGPSIEFTNREFSDREDVRKKLEDQLRGSNRKAFATLRDELFDSINLKLSTFEERALNERNHLFHNGFLRPRPSLTDTDALQWYYDESCALRNLAARAILRLMGYSGNIQDCLTFRPRSIFEASNVRPQFQSLAIKSTSKRP
jgi:hypothetical protein